MGKGAFESFPAPAQQALPARAAKTPTVSVDGVARLRLVFPLTPAAIWFRDVAAEADGFKIDEFLVAVIALVPDDLGKTARRHHGLDVLRRGDQRRAARRHIAFIGVLHRHRHDRAGVEVDRLLRLVREVRAGRPSSW